MSARVLSPKWLGLFIIVAFGAQAVVRTDDGSGSAAGAGSTFAGQSLPAGVTVRGPGGATVTTGAPGQATAATAAAGDAAGGGGGGGGKKGPGGAIGGNIKAVNAILNPDKDKAGPSTTPPPPDPMTQDDLRDLLLDNSVASYPGYCPCPYSRNVDGFECGVEAAYYKPGGFRIKCYPQNLKGQDYIFYRKNN